MLDSGRRLDTSDWTQNTRYMDLVKGDSLLFIHARGTRNVVAVEVEPPGDLASARFLHAFDTGPYLGTRDHAASMGHGVFISFSGGGA